MDEEEILIVRDTLSAEQLDRLVKQWYTTMVKGVADVERGVIALGGEWHMDANAVLLADGSQQEYVWGFNIYPDAQGDILVFESLINIRPTQGNMGMVLEDESLRKKIRMTVAKCLPHLGL